MEATIHCLVRFSTQMLGERHNSGKLNVVYEFYFLKKEKSGSQKRYKRENKTSERSVQRPTQLLPSTLFSSWGKVELKGCGLKVR